MRKLLSWSLIFYLSLLPHFAVSSDLHCSVSNIETIFDHTEKNFCVIIEKREIIDENPIVKIDVETFEILGFKISNYALGKFPENLANFTQITALEISNCQLTKISSNDLETFANLKFISLESNNISVIAPMLFVNNPNLEEISFKNNPIVHIDPIVFRMLISSVTKLDLSGNKCGLTSEAPHEIFKDIEDEKCTVKDCKVITDGYTEIIKSFGNLKMDFRDLQSQLMTASKNLEEKQKELDAKTQELEQQICDRPFENDGTTLIPEPDYAKQLDDLKDLNNELEAKLLTEEAKYNEAIKELEEKLQKAQELNQSEVESLQTKECILWIFIALLIVLLVGFCYFHFRVVRERSSYEPKEEEKYSVRMSRVLTEE